MELAPREEDRLLLFTITLVAERRLARGLKLNYPGFVVLTNALTMGGVRGDKSMASLVGEDRCVLTREQVVEGVPEMIPDIQVGTTFPDGLKLVTVHNPII